MGAREGLESAIQKAYVQMNSAAETKEDLFEQLNEVAEKLAVYPGIPEVMLDELNVIKTKFNEFAQQNRLEQGAVIPDGVDVSLEVERQQKRELVSEYIRGNVVDFIVPLISSADVAKIADSLSGSGKAEIEDEVSKYLITSRFQTNQRVPIDYFDHRTDTQKQQFFIGCHSLYDLGAKWEMFCNRNDLEFDCIREVDSVTVRKPEIKKEREVKMRSDEWQI